MIYCIIGRSSPLSEFFHAGWAKLWLRVETQTLQLHVHKWWRTNLVQQLAKQSSELTPTGLQAFRTLQILMNDFIKRDSKYCSELPPCNTANDQTHCSTFPLSYLVDLHLLPSYIDTDDVYEFVQYSGCTVLVLLTVSWNIDHSLGPACLTLDYLMRYLLYCLTASATKARLVSENLHRGSEQC